MGERGEWENGFYILQGDPGECADAPSEEVTKMTLRSLAWLTVELLDGLCHFQKQGKQEEEQVWREMGKWWVEGGWASQAERPQGLSWRQ